MANEFNDMKALLNDIKVSTDASAARLTNVGSQIDVQMQRLTDLIAALKAAGSGMTAAEKAELVTDAEAIKASLANASGSLDDEVTRLTETGVDPVDPTPTTDVNTVNQAGADAGIGLLGDVIANDNPNLAAWKSSGYITTTTV